MQFSDYEHKRCIGKNVTKKTVQKCKNNSNIQATWRFIELSSVAEFSR